MKRIYYLPVFFVLIISCKNDPVEITNDQGVVIEKYQINKDSLKHGLYEGFYEEGSLREQTQFKEGNYEGLRTMYYADGVVEIEETYSNNELHGPFKAFHKNGVLNLEVEYVNGQMNGLLKRYYDTGTLQEEVTIVDGIENGPFKEYFSNGQVEWEGKYVNGDNEDGLLVQYEEDGSIIKKMQCQAGVCRTIWTAKDGDIKPSE